MASGNVSVMTPSDVKSDHFTGLLCSCFTNVWTVVQRRPTADELLTDGLQLATERNGNDRTVLSAEAILVNNSKEAN